VWGRVGKDAGKKKELMKRRANETAKGVDAPTTRLKQSKGLM